MKNLCINPPVRNPNRKQKQNFLAKFAILHELLKKFAIINDFCNDCKNVAVHTENQ